MHAHTHMHIWEQQSKYHSYSEIIYLLELKFLQNLLKFLPFNIHPNHSDHIFLVFKDRVCVCNSHGCPGTTSCRQCRPQTRRDPPVLAFHLLGLKVCINATWQCDTVFKRKMKNNQTTTIKHDIEFNSWTSKTL